jgi:flagellar protein FliO/FliZ
MNTFRAATSARAFRAAATLVAISFGAAAVAQETARPFAAPATVNSAPPSGIASLGQVTLALGLVLAVIFLAAWALRRMRGFGKTGTGVLDIVADLPVGQKERIALVRVGNTQVLVGIAPGRVNTLHVLPEPVEIPTRGSGTGFGGGGSGVSGTTLGAGGSAPGANTGERPSFKSLLLKSLGK